MFARSTISGNTRASERGTGNSIDLTFFMYQPSKAVERVLWHLFSMKKFLFLILATLSVLPLFARDFPYTYEGQTLWYTVLDESAKTVQTREGHIMLPNYVAGNNVIGDLILPETVYEYNGEAYTLTKLGYCAFSYCRHLYSVTIPSSVILIDDYAFYGCDNGSLTSVIIPNSVKLIGEKAFSYCNGLKKSAYPSTVSNPFSSGVAVRYPAEEAEIEDGFIWSPDKSTIYFAPLSLENEYIIPQSVEAIGSNAFSFCKRLTSVTVPNSVKSIENSSFFGCSGLTSVELGNSVTSIGASAFSECSGLTSVELGNSVTSIGASAFSECSGLTSVKIPNVNTWSRIDFGNSTSNPLYYAHNLYVGDKATPIRRLVIEGEEPVSSYAFFNASCLKKVRIKDGASIETDAFRGCSNLTDVSMNSGELCSEAFAGCSSLKNIYVPVATPPAAPDNAFSNYADINLYVPVGSVSVYENADYCWWRFDNIFESDFADLDTLFAPDYENIASIEEVEYNSFDKANCFNDIFTLQGVCVKRNATQEDVKALAPGLYIIAGKKVLVK